jgi:protein-L-isoaspartate(D-aspartate) O-methyltransferase
MIRKQEDTYRHKGLRKILVQQIREKGITNESVLHAIDQIPRHFFLDPAFDKIAYEDRAFPIGEGQTISQPYTVAYQTQLLQVNKLDKVLEIGTGSVYQASILAELGAWVYTIERQKKLFDKNQLYYPFKTKYRNIKFFYGDGYKGLPTFGPFQRILITAAAPEIPELLIQQLDLGGVMVLPLGSDDKQVMTRITKTTSSELLTETFDDFQFVPMLKGKEEG